MELNNSETYLHDACSFKTTQGGTSETIIRTYRRRYWMLFLFSTLSMLCGTVFPQYAIMANVTMCFYDVSAESVNWTCLIFMVVYVILVFPVSWLTEKTGVKLIIITGSVCNTVSYAVQFAILSPDRFSLVMITSFFGSLSNVCVLSIPPCLAAAWFPSGEISRACAMGVFGNQLGVALGFLLSPLLISDDCANKDLIADGKWNIAVILTTINVIVLLTIIITFQSKPKFPPSISQAEKKEGKELHLRSTLSMAKNLSFVLIFMMYGLIVGTYFAFSTLLNSIVLLYFPDTDTAIGWMGLLFVVAGLLGSIIAGYILDYTHMFKETTICISSLSFIFYIVFCCLLQVNKLWLQFITISILGFFLTSFLPVGFEYAIEVTYPESEIMSAGLLNSSSMIFGIIITEIASHVFNNLGPKYAHGVLSIPLVISTVISCFITKKYKRREKNNAA